jgi:hypothetical protein
MTLGIIAGMKETFNSLQVEGFRRMSPAQKLELVAHMHRTGVQLKMAGLRLKNPDWPDERLEREARRSLLHAGT